jgi:hypothetical protein
MRNLLLFLLLVNYSIVYSQKKINIDFYDYVVSENYINKNVKFDSSFVKPLIDTLKSYVVDKKRLDLPKLCNRTDSYISDLNDYMMCFTSSFLQDGLLLYNHFPIEENLTRKEMFSKFGDYIKENMTKHLSPDFKVYIDIFEFEHEIITYFVDPINLISYETKETTNNCFMFFIIYL